MKRINQVLAHDIKGVCIATSSGQTAINAAIKRGDLKARKFGRKVIVLDDDLRAWLASLPLTGQRSAAA